MLCKYFIRTYKIYSKLLIQKNCFQKKEPSVNYYKIITKYIKLLQNKHWQLPIAITETHTSYNNESKQHKNAKEQHLWLFQQNKTLSDLKNGVYHIIIVALKFTVFLLLWSDILTTTQNNQLYHTITVLFCKFTDNK